jgi:hypothetical protein
LSDPGKKQVLSIACYLGEVITNGFDHHKMGKTGYAEIYLRKKIQYIQDVNIAHIAIDL